MRVDFCGVVLESLVGINHEISQERTAKWETNRFQKLLYPKGHVDGHAAFDL